jgi:hypothetical protein
MKKSEFSAIENLLEQAIEKELYFLATNVSHENNDDGSEFHLRIFQQRSLDEEKEAQDEQLIQDILKCEVEFPADDKNWIELKDERILAGFREFHNIDGRYFKISLSDFGIYVSYFLSAM